MLTPQNLVSDKTPLRSLLRIVLLVIVGFIIIGPLLGLVISSAFYTGDLLSDLQTTNIQPGFLQAILTMQGIVTFVGLIVFPILYITRLEHKSMLPFFPRQEQLGWVLIFVAGISLTFPVAISPVAEWNMNVKFPEFMSGFEQWAMQEEERSAKRRSAITNFKPGDLPQASYCSVACIGEELVFRGMIQRELWRGTLNIHIAIWVSAAIFSAIHMQFYGFVPRLLLGALFGYLYYWSDNLLIPIFSHFFNNAFAVIMVHLYNLNLTEVNMEEGDAAHFNMFLWYGVNLGLIYIFGNRQDVPPTRGNPRMNQLTSTSFRLNRFIHLAC
jgi:membrane protease YdiL (CAAX protease family)